ncbi:hypothetical protein B0H16DRAFT_1449321 [Mycena metata]|uniref:Uncharacterized protein n=1 Tax=Mycena metata TaxID=1033252 RepID=A0AAD7K7D9_9AGAR|nr:hypothetical protein B0H16DRAFT_1449321 [Mycena metata]
MPERSTAVWFPVHLFAAWETKAATHSASLATYFEFEVHPLLMWLYQALSGKKNEEIDVSSIRSGKLILTILEQPEQSTSGISGTGWNYSDTSWWFDSISFQLVVLKVNSGLALNKVVSFKFISSCVCRATLEFQRILTGIAPPKTGRKSAKLVGVGNKANSTKNEDDSAGRRSTRLRMEYPGSDGEEHLRSRGIKDKKK